MKKERSLSYLMSQKIAEKELTNISGATTTVQGTFKATYINGSWDTEVDVTSD